MKRLKLMRKLNELSKIAWREAVRGAREGGKEGRREQGRTKTVQRTKSTTSAPHQSHPSKRRREKNEWEKDER
jgi:hypothetical protein